MWAGRKQGRTRTHQVFSLTTPKPAPLPSVSNKGNGSQINVALVQIPTLFLLGPPTVRSTLTCATELAFFQLGLSWAGLQGPAHQGPAQEPPRGGALLGSRLSFPMRPLPG